MFTNYKIEFSSKVPTYKGDKLYIKFPESIRTPMIPECNPPDITIPSCVTKINCGTETGKIVATFEEVICKSSNPEDDRFIFYIKNVQNAANFITS